MKKYKAHNSIEVDEDGLEIIKQITDSHRYQVSTDLYSQGNTPFVAYLLVEGVIELYRDKKTSHKIGPGTIVGLTELMHHSSSYYSARIHAGGVVHHIDRSTILEILENKDERLRVIFNQVASA